MKSELQQLITELENEIINYDQNRSRAHHVSTLKKIARNMQKELDRMPEFDISIPNRNENKIQVVKNIIILSDDSGDDGSCMGSLEDLIGDIELDLEPIDRGPEVSCTPPKENI